MLVITLQFFGIIFFGLAVLFAEVLYSDSRFMKKKEQNVFRCGILIFLLIGFALLYFVIQQYNLQPKSDLAAAFVVACSIYAVITSHKLERHSPFLIALALAFLSGKLVV
jgi:hypothetical protein